ncbi:MAG: DUF4393 domain-containing protein [Solirubrobacterales bacterium]|nr:DUF4393 domain-containing protein [Solirubrobacterales bacterium]
MSEFPDDFPKATGERVSGELVEDWSSRLARLPRDADNPVRELLELLPALGRLTTGAWIRSTVWGVEAGFKVGARVVRIVVPAEARELVADLGDGLRVYAREMLGLDEIDRRLQALMDEQQEDVDDTASLKSRGAELLRQSADVEADDGAHPAYARILTELAPDEARMLRLIARDGPQPAIDVRASNLIGVGSQLVAPRLNMMGTEAGVRHPARVPAYLNNLDRLGLICLSDDALDDPGRYQVLEAQPDAMDAIRRAGRARTVHRSVRLTDFGRDFCEVCLPLDEEFPRT